MRHSFGRLSTLVGSIALVVSCDAGPTVGKFGNGIAGGTTGTAPVTPPPPGSVDTNPPFLVVDTPFTGQLVNVADSVLVVTRILDDRAVGGFTITGFKETGDPNLGTFVRTVRYGPLTVPAGSSFPAGLTDTTVRRYLQPAVPVDTTVGPMVIMIVGRDAAGNVDTVTRTVQIVTGPRVAITSPVSGDSVPRGIAMSVSVRVQHNEGISRIRITANGENTWPTALNDTVTQVYTTGPRDTVLTALINIPANAPLRGRITIGATALDVNGNPGSTAPVLVFVRDVGTLSPRVFQEVPARIEFADSITVTANGDGIVSMGLILRDSVGNLLTGGDTVTFAAPLASNRVQRLAVQLGLQHQGQRITVVSFATDQNGNTGFSMQAGTQIPNTSLGSAFNDTTFVTFGQTYALPRSGVIGDLAVDEVRGNVFLSNTQFNLLEVWANGTKNFRPSGVAVGALPWGLFVSNNPDTLLVGNSGATTISRVCIGNCVSAPMHEDLARRIRTRNTIIFTVQFQRDESSGKIRIVRLPDVSYSDRPQYVVQTAGGRVMYSTRPTPSAPAGTLRWLDPALPFPDPRQIWQYGTQEDGDNFVYTIFNADSIRIGATPANSLLSDTLHIFDHPYGQLGPTITGTDSLPLRAGSDVNGLGGDVEMVLGLDVSSLGLTDTTFVAASGDRTWIGFGEGNTNGTGRVMMVNDPVGPVPGFFSPSTTVRDLVDNASERVFGLAIDSTGLQVTAHGLQTYVAALDNPFHLRLDGVYDSFDNGAGVAYHPRAKSTGSANENRVLFTATQNGVIEIVDVAHYNNRGRIITKGDLYGPLRATGPLPGDPPDVILKLYGLTSNGL
ncbi:MAG TPA: hypothetical protein VEB19_07525, partial [Gemmatimonadaceae bacterium]|nr:hypothetical protein [Gemmatimonadaceae bacterium]